MSVQPVTLEGRHVRLEPLSLAHHADLCEAGLDEELWRWIPGQVMTVLRMRTCGSPECRAVFAVCANCHRGQRYCSPSCRETVRRGQRRAADRRYQQSERGRQFHRRRQCRYRERQAPAPVTDQGCQKINSPTTSASSGHPPLHNLRSVQPLDQSISSGSATEVISGTVARCGSSSKIYVSRRSPTGPGASQRQLREKLLDAARRREIDVVLVWRLDRWGRSVADLLATLQELDHLGVGFVSLTEALDLSTPAGGAMAGLLAVFAEFERDILRKRVRAGLEHARQTGKRLGRPATAALHASRVCELYHAGVRKAEIARRLRIGRTSVRGILKAKR